MDSYPPRSRDVLISSSLSHLSMSLWDPKSRSNFLFFDNDIESTYFPHDGTLALCGFFNKKKKYFKGFFSMVLLFHRVGCVLKSIF